MPRACTGKPNASRGWLRRALITIISLVSCAGASSCAASRDPDPSRPRASNEPPYPVILAAGAERRDQALAGWAALARDQNLRNEPPPPLQPVTATISALPTALDAPLRLPLVEIRDEAGEVREASKEESRRESLRRFITGAGALLGVTPQNLSLVERKDETDGTRRARYQQHPFPYPLRAGFGILEITFTDDRRVLSLSSTAIPDTERLSRALALVRPQQLTAEQAVERLRGRSFTFPGINASLTYTVAPDDPIIPRELVVYPVRSANDAGTLELHVAWEIIVGKGATPYLVYLDALSGGIIAATTQAVQEVEEKQQKQ